MIEIEGLPEGWKPLKVKISCNISNDASVMQCAARVDLERIKPREITLVETEQDNIKHDGKWCNQHFRDGLILTQQPKYWRIKEE
mgnify:FL=1